ncbi:Anion permease ArsB/NhaD-like protein [Candidatus Burkholderia pumila]|uniref:Anion permease ArsB/NhaD-like protein n=1 Tax=Candidatus Burkholderia pumila TaxID=1090375 RepID=A0ABR5HMS4_9BURK|nr:Anion permease ArsB/NhaD-like protein [Candidatus Burkholderia pumila]
MSEANVKQLRSDLFARIWQVVSKEPVLSIFVFALIVLQIAHPRPLISLLGLVDWQTVFTLAGLLILTKAIELSGFLIWAAHKLVHHIYNERTLALLLIALAAALSTVLTNDVALFAVVPLALSLHKLAPLPIKRLVILIALSVNAGSILTPLGNPQNLFLWQRSGMSFGAFVWTLLPLYAALMALLGIVTFAMFRAKPLDLSGDVEEHRVDRVLCGISVIAFGVFVALADAHHVGPALVALAIGFLLWHREILLRIDFLLLLIFILMFIVLRSAAALPAIHDTIAHLGIDTPVRAYAAGAVLSQGISNVPAAIVLAEFSKDWRALAFGVSVGGFGVAIGSLANLIAVRLFGEKGMWTPFHMVAIPFWIMAVVIGWAFI